MAPCLLHCCSVLLAGLLQLDAAVAAVQYLDVVREVIAWGVHRPDRTGTGTLSVFGRSLRFDLRYSFPLLTTKKVFFRGGP